MDRSCASEPEHSTAMRTAGSAAFELLLSAAAGERSKSASAPPARSVVFEAPLLRQPQNGCRAGSEPKAHPAHDAVIRKNLISPTISPFRDQQITASLKRVVRVIDALGFVISVINRSRPH